MALQFLNVCATRKRYPFVASADKSRLYFRSIPASTPYRPPDKADMGDAKKESDSKFLFPSRRPFRRLTEFLRRATVAAT